MEAAKDSDARATGETWLKVKDVAKRLGIADSTVRNAIESGHLAAYKLPGRGRGTYRIAERDINAYVERHKYHPARGEQEEVKIVGRPFRHFSLD